MEPWKRAYEDGDEEEEEEEGVGADGEGESVMKSRFVLEEPPMRSSDMGMQSRTESASVNS